MTEDSLKAGNSAQPRDYGGFRNYRKQAEFDRDTRGVWIFLRMVLVIAFSIAMTNAVSRMGVARPVGYGIATFCGAMVVSIWLLATKNFRGRARLVIFLILSAATLLVFFT